MDSKVENTLAWLTHYEREFNESPIMSVGRLVKLLQRYLTGYRY